MISVPQGTVDPNAFPQKIRGVGVKWVCPGWASGFSFGHQNLGNGFLYYIPIFVEEATTYDRIAIKVTTFAVGTSARLGIYTWKDGLPDSLILDAGTVATNANSVKEIVINQLLNRGYYFLAVVANGTPAVQGIDIHYGFVAPVSGSKSTFGDLNTVISVVFGRSGDVAGGLADPAPTPIAGVTGEMAVVNLRES